jgi:hypothetical protein
LVLFVFLVLKSQIELWLIWLDYLHLALHGLPLVVRLGLKDLEHVLRLIDILVLVREARAKLASGLRFEQLVSLTQRRDTRGVGSHLNATSDESAESLISFFLVG